MKIIVLLLLFGQQPAKAKPKFPWPQFITSNAIHVMAGAMDAEAEVLKFKYHLYMLRWPNTNRQWTDPKLSARNKYKNWPEDKSPAFFGSTTFRVGLTDKYHQNRMIRNMLVAGSVGVWLTIGEKQPFGRILLMALSNWMFFAIGSGLTHYYYETAK